MKYNIISTIFAHFNCTLQHFGVFFLGGGECNIHSFHRWKMNWEGRVLNNERARGYKLNAQVKAPLFFHELKWKSSCFCFTLPSRTWTARGFPAWVPPRCQALWRAPFYASLHGTGGVGFLSPHNAAASTGESTPAYLQRTKRINMEAYRLQQSACFGIKSYRLMRLVQTNW